MSKLLIIGVGSIGERHLRCAARIDRAELAICETNAELRTAIADRYGVHEAYADLEAAMRCRPTAAVICVPAPLHVPFATRLVEAGTHVLIEKPLSTSLEGVNALLQAVQHKGVVAGVAYVHRAHPSLMAMRQAVQSGRFGRPIELIAVTGQNFPHYRPTYRNTYYRDRATGGGAIQDALTHIVNAGEWLIGPVDRVQADAAHQLVPDVDVEDTVHVLARHGGIPAVYALNQHQSPSELTITVVCEKGTVRYEMHETRWRWMVEPSSTWHEEPGPQIERDDLFITQLTAFFDAIEGRNPPLCSLPEGIQTLRVNLAMLRALDAPWTDV